MITKEIIKKNLCSQFLLQEEEISHEENLFMGHIDSLDFLAFAKNIEKLADCYGIAFEIKDFLYSECYSIDEIFNYLAPS